ncbi:GINS complex, Psf3 component [Hanseniaspora valbyensis NRRL Y-1626]|uniref:DNA replication complex GINS protein PSF3 n=1 Tax=Hanseniaspora valbyensis NRRL Y-1626 TaxID=766949 RepID=A0A1B7TIS1_9ASCO|nr:GINS complex, Psf3 component [Hanseniaspora valbyensis NRRL Y-1626]
MSYYDLDDILADSVKVPTKFNYTVPGLGYLENNPNKPLNKNNKLDLPLWLAKELAVLEISENNGNIHLIELITPEIFHQRITNIIKSDSTSLDAYSLCPYFYTVYEKWAYFYSSKKISELAVDMLRSRGVKINNYASFKSNSSSNKTSYFNESASTDFMQTLDEFEKKLFILSQESYQQMNTYLQSKE